MRWPFTRDQEIRGLSLTALWAYLVAIKAKRIETRSWSTQYRGLVAIHASRKFPKAERALCWRDPFRSALIEGGLDGNDDHLPLGVIVAIARLSDVWSTAGMVAVNAMRPAGFDELLTPKEEAFGDYSEGRYGFVLRDVIALKTRVPAKGALGLWTFDKQPEALADVRRQLREAA